MNNIEHSVEQLFSDLFDNPSKFNELGKANELLNKYFHGLPIDTLKPLLVHENSEIRSAAIFIASELGNTSNCLIEEVSLLVDDPDPHIQWDALESIMLCSAKGNFDKFLLIIKHLEDKHDSIRRLAMRLISNANESQLNTAYDLMSGSNDNISTLHSAGLSVLLKGNSIKQTEIMSMLNNPIQIVRQYGAIAAKRLFKDFPELLKSATTNSDADIINFSTDALEMALRLKDRNK
jgi:hypothetical protein